MVLPLERVECVKSRAIVCGLDSTGYKVLTLLRQQGIPVAGVHDRPIPGDADTTIGDMQEASTLLAGGIREAQTLILASADESPNLAILMQARTLNPRIRIVNRLFTPSLGNLLDRTLPDHVSMSVAALAAPVFAFAALGNRAIGQLHLFDRTWPIHEEYIDERHPWRDRRLADLWDDRRRMPIYYLPVNIPNPEDVDLISAVVQNRTLQVGDRLIVGTQPSVRTTRASLTRRCVNLLVRLQQVQRQSQAVLGVALALAIATFLATATFAGLQSGISPVDALYFSVGMIAGAGGNERVVEGAPDHLKLFAVAMMIVGAATIGIWYALLNDFVLSTHFKQVWHTVQIPKRNHHIICGVGDVGMQIASQLRALGHDVVAIERDPNNRFLNTLRGMGIPVILDDASLPATLKAAHLDTATSLLAVTSRDKANLEIALNAKGLAPRIPTIVRYEDPKFARMAQQVFDFDTVLSPSEIVTPSFAAAALGGKILGNGITADTLWVALATLITAKHPFCGQVVKVVAMAADFVPLYLETRSQTVHGWELLDVPLSEGDVLYLTIPATQLDRLWSGTPRPAAVSTGY